MTARAEGNNPSWYTNRKVGRRLFLSGSLAAGAGVLAGACESNKDVYGDVKLAGYYPGYVGIRNGSIQEGLLNARTTPQVMKDESNLYTRRMGNGGLWGVQDVNLLKPGENGPVSATSASEFIAVKNPGIVVGPDGDYWIPLKLETYTHTQYTDPNGATSNRYKREKSTWYVSFDPRTEAHLIPVDDKGEPIISDLNPHNGIIPVNRKSDGSYVTSSDKKPIADLGKGVVLNNSGDTFPPLN